MAKKRSIITKHLIELVGLTRAEVEAVVADDNAPLAKLIAARELLNAIDGTPSKSGIPVSAASFDRVLNRLEGMPQRSPDTVIGNVQVLNMTTADLLDKIDGYLRKQTSTTDIRPQLSLPDHQPSDLQDADRECTTPQDPASSG